MLESALALLDALGIPVAVKKTILPCLCLKFIGFFWDLENRRVTLDPARWAALSQTLQTITTRVNESANGSFVRILVADLQSLIGRLEWASMVIECGRMYLACCRRALTGCHGNSMKPKQATTTWATLGLGAITELRWWLQLTTSALRELERNPAALTPGRDLAALALPPTPTILCRTDASDVNLGAWWTFSPGDSSLIPDGVALEDNKLIAAQGLQGWLQLPVPEMWHIGTQKFWLEHTNARPTRVLVSSGWLEYAAVLAAVTHWGAQWHGRTVQLVCDNRSVVRAWLKKSSPSPILSGFTRAVALRCALHEISLYLTWSPGTSNSLADHLSRVSRWQTWSSPLGPTLQTTPSWRSPAPVHVITAGMLIN